MEKIVFILFLFLVSCATNKLDDRKMRVGRWKVYHDDDKKVLMFKGRYKNGHQAGQWKYYNYKGNLYLSERYLKDSRIKTIYYQPNGKKELEGYAHYYETLDTAYYKWEGNWLKYDSTGTLTRISYYKFGKFAWFVPLSTYKKQ